MKNKLLPLAVVLLSGASYAQVGIGTLTPNKSSQLEIVASDKGILIPRVTLTNVTDATTINNGNINSLLVFNTTDNQFIKPGYYYWFIDKWLRIINQADLEATNTTNESLTVSPDNNLVLTDSDGNTIFIPIADLNIITTLVNNNNGTYTYTSEDNTVTTINVPADVISNFQNIVNNTTVLNELIEVLNETKVGGNVYYDGTTFTYVDNAGVSQTINFQQMVQDNETVTTLVNNNDGTYTYTSEDNTVTTINVPADVISNFQNIVNNTTVLNELIEVLNETKVGGNVYYDGTTFTYVDNAGVSQTINFQQMVQDNETVTTLVNNNDGTYTYTSEDNTVTTINVPSDVISNFQNIVNNTTVLNELIEVLNETKVGGNVYYDGTTFTYVDNAGVSQTINFQQMVQDNETVTTLVNNNDGTYTYTSEDNTVTTINVPADVISNFQNIVNNTTVLNELIEVLNETKVGGNVYYDGTTFTYVDNAGVSQTINFQQMVQDNETVTTLVRNANGTFTYLNEANASVTIDPNMVNVTYENGVYTFKDATGTTITDIDANASGIVYNNTTSQLAADNVQDAIDELAGRKGNLSGTGLTVTNGDNATLKNTSIAITPGTAGQLMITKADGTTGWVDQDQIVPITTNTYVNNGTNTLTSTVNGEIASASIINTVTNAINGTSLVTTVNGVASTTTDLKTAIQAGQKTTRVNAGSNKVAVTTTNPTTDETLYTVDVNEANLTLNNIGGTLNTNKITPGTAGQILSVVNGVPTWVNDSQITRVTSNTLTLNGNQLTSDVNGNTSSVSITDLNVNSTKTLTGTGITINGSASLTGAVLKDATLAIANDAITTDKIAPGAVQTSDIANNNVTANKLNSTGATAGQVATADGNGNVTYQTPSVNADNVTNGKALSSTDLDLSANAATSLLKNVTANIKANAVTADKLADNSVTPVKIDTAVAGNGLVKNATTNALEVQANNGLTVDATDDAVQLGGALKKATLITTTSNFTLALAGLQRGTAADRIVVADATSGVLKQLKAAMPKFFYMPSIVIPTHSSQFVADPNIPGESFGTLNLYARYTRQFNTPMASNPGKTTALPILPANELDYYITWYDTTVFASVTVSNTGILTYTIQPDADVTVGSFMNIIFAVKEN